MNLVTRRMECHVCGRAYDVTPWLGGCWREVMVNRDAPMPYVIAARRPICVVPECGGKDLTDTSMERVDTADGRTIVVMSCPTPICN